MFKQWRKEDWNKWQSQMQKWLMPQDVTPKGRVTKEKVEKLTS